MACLTPCLALLSSASDEAAALGCAGLACGVIALVVLGIIAIQVAIAAFLSSCLRRVPPPYRKMEPGMAWLLIIPLFHLVWNFFVYKAISESFQGWFQSQGRNEVGDCGRNLGLAYCIVVCVCIIPGINILAGLGSLVLLIMCLVKFSGLKQQIPA